MNVIEKYKVQFVLKKLSNGDVSPSLEYNENDETPINRQLFRFFMTANIGWFGEILTDINHAMSGLSFDEDGGGEVSFLKIGRSTSYLYSLSNPEELIPIPTEDIRELLLEWIKWVNDNPSISRKYR